MKQFILYIGHGRALEFFLGYFKFCLAVSIASSHIGFHVPALSDLSWFYPEYMIAAPFAVIGTLQLSGVILNMKGFEANWIVRFTGAFLAIIIWTTLLIKSSWLNEPTLMIPMAEGFIPASMFLVYKAWNRLPVPGAIGLV